MFEHPLAEPDFTFEACPVVDSHFPDGPGACDAWLIAGSKHGACEAHDWIPPHEEFLCQAYAAGIPIICICFGHQIGKTLWATASTPARMASLHAERIERRQSVCRDVANIAKQRETDLRSACKEKFGANYQQFIAARKCTFHAQNSFEQLSNELFRISPVW